MNRTKIKKPKRNVSFARQLRLRSACSEAVEWVGKRTLAQTWRDCQRGDWMFWLLERSSGWSRDAMNKCLVEILGVALEAARPVAGKETYWAAVESAHRQVRDAIEGRGDLAAASAAARAAASAAARAAASAAARAASEAAWAASEAASAAASEAAWAASAAASAAAHARICDIIRAHFPRAPKLKAIKRGAK